MGKTRQKFHVTFKPKVELKRQRPSKVPLHLEEKLEKLLTQLKDADIIREMGGDDEMGSLFVNPIILIPKNDYVKLVIEARYLNSVTDLTNYSWPLEPAQMIMTRVSGKVFSVSDLSCAYHQVSLSPETQKLTSFIIGGKQYTYTRGFYGLCGLPKFFSRLITIHFDTLIKKKQAITHIVDTTMQSQNKNEMYVDAKSARSSKYLSTDTHIHFPPGSTSQPNRTAVATGLSFISTLCTRSESILPILMENNKNHQITLPKGRIGFSSLDMVDRDEPKYRIRIPYELTNAIVSTDERYNDCFLLHSTVSAQSSDDFLQIIYVTEVSILQQPNSIGHCISTDARMSKGFADFLSHRIPGLRSTCRKAKLFMGQVFPFWDSTGRRYIYNLVTKERFCDKPNLSTLCKTLKAMKSHESMNGVSTIAIPKLGCGLDQMNWQEVVKLLREIFAYADVQIVLYTLEENGFHALSAEGDAEFYADDEIE